MQENFAGKFDLTGPMNFSGIKKKAAGRLFFPGIFLIYVLLIKTQVTENDSSRIATIESLVERHTFSIDEASIMPYADRILVLGHFYSDKPPVFSVVAAAAYWVMHHFLGLSFRRDFDLSYRLLTAVVVCASTTALLYLFYKSLRFVGLDEMQKRFLVLALGFGTLLFPYSLVFNNHTFAAALVFVGFYHILKIKFKEGGAGRNAFIAGFSTSLAASIEMPAGLVYTILFFAYVLARGNDAKTTAAYLAGVVPALLFYSILNIRIVGDLMPPESHGEFLRYPGSYWNNPTGVDALKDSALAYSFNIIFGRWGILTFTPLLVIPLILLFRLSLDRKHPFNADAATVLAGTLIIVGGYIAASWFFGFNYYGGESYGFRFFIAATPVLFFFTAFAYKQKNRWDNAIKMLAVTSFIMTLPGAFISPWIALNIKWVYFWLLMSFVLGLAVFFLLQTIFRDAQTPIIVGNINFGMFLV